MKFCQYLLTEFLFYANIVSVSRGFKNSQQEVHQHERWNLVKGPRGPNPKFTENVG